MVSCILQVYGGPAVASDVICVWRCWRFRYERLCGCKVDRVESERYWLWLKRLGLKRSFKITDLIEAPGRPTAPLVITPFNQTRGTMPSPGPVGSLCTLSFWRALQKLTGGCNISQNNGSSLRGVLIRSYRTHHHCYYLLERRPVPTPPCWKRGGPRTVPLALPALFFNNP